MCHLIALRAGAVEQAAAAEALEAGPRLLLLPPRLGEPQLLGLARAGPGRTVAAARVAEARGHVLGLCELAHGRHEGGGGAEQGEGQVGGPAAPHRLCSTEGLARTGDISTFYIDGGWRQTAITTKTRHQCHHLSCLYMEVACCREWLHHHRLI